MKMNFVYKLIMLSVLTSFISGCLFETEGVDDSLNQILSGVNNRQGHANPPPLPTLPETKRENYNQDQRDPLKNKVYISDDVAAEGVSVPKMDPDRPQNYIPEPLEAYDIGSLKLLGTLRKNGHSLALIQDSEGVTYTIGVGNYIGDRFGRVTMIKESVVQVDEKEFTPDGKVRIVPALLNLETKNI